MVKFACFLLLALTALDEVRGDQVSVQSSCIGGTESIQASYQIDSTSNLADVWIGIYTGESLTDSSLQDLSEGELWSFLCGGQNCDTSSSELSGTVSFQRSSQSWNQPWPLAPGTHHAVISRGDDGDVWPALAVSQSFQVGCNDDDDSETNEPVPVVGQEMVDTIDNARADIESLIGSNQLLIGKFLRLAFHDCVGGCDGCVDMTNPDNVGLVMPIDALDPLVDRYGDRGLSRTDIWMLSAVVASDVSETSVGIDFPFQWIGRQTCEQVNGNDCGRAADGSSSGCNPFAGPHHDLCHGDTQGTRSIQNFMTREFGFNDQQTTAIMGAHTLGAMRDVNLGFEGRNGWDLTNDQLDHGYFVELVGDDDRPPPEWVQVLHRNDDLPGIPDRWQFEVVENGVPLTMLNSDMAMVIDLVEGENLMSDGRVTCDFVGGDECSRETPFSQFVNQYARSRSDFVADYRDALEIMIENGYARDSTCGSNEVCVLRSLL